jgi:hypothetical protein
MTDADDRVGRRDRVVRQHQFADLLGIAHDLVRQFEHRGRRIRRDHAVSGVDQVSREQSAPAPELDDQAAAVEHGFENARIRARRRRRGTRTRGGGQGQTLR